MNEHNNKIWIDMELDLTTFQAWLLKSQLLAKDTGKKLDQALLTKLEVDAANAKLVVDSMTKELQELKRERKLKLQIDSSTSEKEIDRLTAKLKNIDTSVKRERNLLIDTSRAKKSLKEANRDLENYLNTWSTKTSRFSRAFQWLWDSIKRAWLYFLAYFGLNQITQAFRSAIDTAVEFESAFAGINKTLDATPKQFDAIKNQMRKLSLEIPLTVTELSKIAEIGGRMGIAAQDIGTFTETVAKLSTAIDGISTEAAAEWLARVIWLSGEWIENIDRLGASLVELGNNLKTDEGAIISFAERIAGAWGIVGLTSNQILGISAAFADVGIQAEAGWTAVQKTLLIINNAVNNAWAELEKFAVLSGMSAQEFWALWKKDAWAWFLAFVDWLKDSWEDAANVLAELIGADVRLARAFLSVAWAGWQLEKSLRLSEDAFEDNVALQEEFAKRLDTNESKLKIQQNEAKLWWEVIGWDLAPKLIWLNDMLLNFLPKAFFGLKIIMQSVAWYLLDRVYALQIGFNNFFTFINWFKNSFVWVLRDIWANFNVLVHNIWEAFNAIPWAIANSLKKGIKNVENFLNWAIDWVNKFAQKLWFDWVFDRVNFWVEFDYSSAPAYRSFVDTNRKIASLQNQQLLAERDKYNDMKELSIEFNKERVRNEIESNLEAGNIRSQLQNKARLDREKEIKSEIKAEAEKARQILDELNKLDEAKASWGKAAADAIEKEKELTKQLEDSKKSLTDAVKEYNDTLDDWREIVQDFYDEVVDWADKSQEKIAKLTEDIQELQDKLNSETEDKDVAIAERKLELEEERLKVLEEIEERKANWESFDDLNSQLWDIDNELWLVNSNLNQEVYDKILEDSKKNQTELLLDQFEQTKANIEKEIEEKQKLLEAEKEIYEKIYDIRVNLEEKFDTFLKTKINEQLNLYEQLRLKAIWTVSELNDIWINNSWELDRLNQWNVTNNIDISLDVSDKLDAVEVAEEVYKKIEKETSEWAKNYY